MHEDTAVTGVCADCQFYEALRGICRFHAPEPLVEPTSGSAFASWPKVQGTDTCGNFETATVITGDCSDCWFYASGLCAYHAPEIRVDRAKGSAYSDWPFVATDDWCGRWSAVEVDPETVTWEQVTGKPATFPPEAHTHPWGEVTDKPATFPPEVHTHSWGVITDKPSVFPPEAHNHDWADITTGVPSVFPPDTHVHDWSDITTGVPATFPPSGHTHPLSELTGPTGASAVVGTAVDTVSTVNVPGADGNYVLHAEKVGSSITFSWHTEGDLATTIAWADITGKPATFPPSSHTHPITTEVTAGTDKIFYSDNTGAIKELSKPSDGEWVLLNTVTGGAPVLTWVLKSSLAPTVEQFHYESLFCDSEDTSATPAVSHWALPAFGGASNWREGGYTPPWLSDSVTDEADAKAEFTICPAPFTGEVSKITITNMVEDAASGDCTVKIVKAVGTDPFDATGALSNTVIATLASGTLSKQASNSGTFSSGNTFNEGDLLWVLVEQPESASQDIPWRINIKYKIA